MRKYIPIILLSLFAICPLSLRAVVYADIQDSVAAIGQLRLGADFDWKFERVTLSFGEEIRSNLYPTPQLALANTTLSANFNIVKGYFSGHAGYILRVRGTKFETGDVNKILRHRVFFGLNEHFKFGIQKQWAISLRERAVLNIRTDEPNLFEKQAYSWEMRYRLQMHYKSLSKPLTPYVWTELVHTCNATEMQKYYAGGNYISSCRAAIGMKWRLDNTNSLNFYLRYDWSHDFDIDADKEGAMVKTAYEIKQHSAILGISYNFGWKK